MGSANMSSTAQAALGSETILLTGATGFLGLALVLRLLRVVACKRVILIIRGGKKRFEQVCRDGLPVEQLGAIELNETITIFDGDVEKQSLGLRDEDVGYIKNVTTIYIHAASSISFHRQLKSLLSSIIESSLRVAEIALNSPQLKYYVYISTAYANSHLAKSDHESDVHVAEDIHCLRSGSGDSTLLEYQDLQSTGTIPEFEFHNFPFPYAYAKHLTERLLRAHFGIRNRGSCLLIIRPSSIGPALRDPYPGYQIHCSAPAIGFLAALLWTPSFQLRFASHLLNPSQDSTLDEIPVDLVVNRIVAHLSWQTSGVVHAVAGTRGRHRFDTLWQIALTYRNIPWRPRLVWQDVDWRDESLHWLARYFVIFGTSLAFEDVKTLRVWQAMSAEERATFPLFLENAAQYEDFEPRRNGVRTQLNRYCVKKGLQCFVADTLCSARQASESGTNVWAGFQRWVASSFVAQYDRLLRRAKAIT